MMTTSIHGMLRTTQFIVSRYYREALKSLVGHFIEKSLEVLERDRTATALQDEFPKLDEQLVKRTMVKDIKSIEMKMRTTLATLNDDKDGVHFRNGRYILITSQFEERRKVILEAVENPHFVSEFIPYDWAPSSMDDMNAFHATVLSKAVREP
jgi:hypothetical protein